MVKNIYIYMFLDFTFHIFMHGGHACWIYGLDLPHADLLVTNNMDHRVICLVIGIFILIINIFIFFYIFIYF